VYICNMTTHICTVCLEPLSQQECPVVATIPCGHSYHEHCLNRWSTERFSPDKEEDDDDDDENKPEIFCPLCNASVASIVKLFLSTRTGVDDSLGGKELEFWRNEYDAQQKQVGEPAVAAADTNLDRLRLHTAILNSNKAVIDEIFEKQKIMETYENDRKENQRLRQELFQQIMKHEAEMRKMEANKQIITEVLERNEKTLKDLKSTQEENLDLKRELLKNIMSKQADVKELTASKKALTVAMEQHEVALHALKESREENLGLKKELVEALHNHKIKMEELWAHKESLHDIVLQHAANIDKLKDVKKQNLKLQEEVAKVMEIHRKDAKKIAKCEGWIEVLKEEVEALEEDRKSLKLVRNENCRLGVVVKDTHKRWMQAQRELHERTHQTVTNKMSLLIAVGQIGLLGFVINRMDTSSRR